MQGESEGAKYLISDAPRVPVRGVARGAPPKART